MRAETRTWIHYALIFGSIFAIAFGANSVGILFPITWHPDELSKANQIQTGSFNFFHPQLLLVLTKLLNGLLHPDDSARSIVLSGRLVSAAAAAAAVAIMSIVVVRRFGILFGLLSAILLGMTPAVFVNAHFFKEDAVLLLGCSLVLLALQTFDRQPARPTAALLGVSLGVACSAKYAGVIMLIPAIAMIAEKRSCWIDLVVTLVCGAMIFVLINAAGIFGSSSLVAGLRYELQHVTSGHTGLQFGPTSTIALKLLLRNTAAVLILLWLGGLLLCCWSMVFKRRLTPGQMQVQLSPFEKSLYFTPPLFILAIQMSMVVLPRYVMPATAMITLAAVWSAARLFGDRRAIVAGIAAVVLLFAGGIGSIPSFAAAVSVFTDPPRMKVANWISANFPADAKIAADFYAGIPDQNFAKLDPALRTLPQAAKIVREVSEDISFENLRAAGFTHIVTSAGNYGRFFSTEGNIFQPTAQRRKQYYEDVFSKLTLIYDQPARVEVDDLFDARISVYEFPRDQKP